MSSVKTLKGTELPLLDLKGKNYLEVKWRIVWFREEKPDWAIETEYVQLSDTRAVAKATVKDEKGRVISTGHKTEDKAGFFDFAEKAESGAIGRALALIGYGTQFAAELEEGERIVDSPVSPKANLTVAPSDPGAYVITFGKKFKDMRLDECDPYELNNFYEWLKKEKNSPKGISDQMHQAMVNIGWFLDSRERPASAQVGSKQ